MRLFGTDGIRAPVGAPPLDEASLLRLGAALGALHSGGRILIGRDTRESGEELERLLCRGLGGGVRIFLTGIVPTPAVSFLVRRHRFDCGIVISASHNPWNENGIKCLNRFGEKVSPAWERRIEALAASPLRPRPRPSAPPEALPFPGGDEYLEHLIALGRDGAGAKIKLVVDGANGSASSFAPPLFRALGASLIATCCRPDGRNINRGCGSTSPQGLCRKVVEKKADLGIAFDGDADRVVFADRRGHLLEGDHTLYLLARHLQSRSAGKERQAHFPAVVVGTVMSNLGLGRALARRGIAFVRADVGDRSVYRQMKRHHAILGGEPSGHTILRDYLPCGDGLRVALAFIAALSDLGLGADDLFRKLPLYPQQVLSLKISRKKPLGRWPELGRLVADFGARHGSYSRALIRYSGTEPKIRIMIESRDSSVITNAMDRFVTLIRSELGG